MSIELNELFADTPTKFNPNPLTQIMTSNRSNPLRRPWAWDWTTEGTTWRTGMFWVVPGNMDERPQEESVVQQTRERRRVIVQIGTWLPLDRLAGGKSDAPRRKQEVKVF